jgi:hypothetical protein
MIEGNLAGPLSRRASFMIGGEHRDMQDTTIINALTVDPAFQVTPFRQAVVTPTANTEFNARLDYQLSTNHTLVGRFDWEDRTQANAGLDTFSLPSRAFERGTAIRSFKSPRRPSSTLAPFMNSDSSTSEPRARVMR